MSYEDLKPLPLYRLGVLDRLVGALAGEWRDRFVTAVTIRASKGE